MLCKNGNGRRRSRMVLIHYEYWKITCLSRVRNSNERLSSPPPPGPCFCVRQNVISPLISWCWLFDSPDYCTRLWNWLETCYRNSNTYVQAVHVKKTHDTHQSPSVADIFSVLFLLIKLKIILFTPSVRNVTYATINLLFSPRSTHYMRWKTLHCFCAVAVY